jgi:hypothetical protein
MEMVSEEVEEKEETTSNEENLITFLQFSTYFQNKVYKIQLSWHLLF